MKNNFAKSKRFIEFKKSKNTFSLFCFLPFLFSCGSKKNSTDQVMSYIGLHPSYEAPLFDYEYPDVQDINFQKLKPQYSDPYWIQSLQMENGEKVISDIFEENGRIFLYSFPDEKPNYLVESISWSPASTSIREVTRTVFEQLQKVFQVEFLETSEIAGMNLIAISQSVQSDSAGFSYYPNNFFQLGSDIFISNRYTNPHQKNDGLTNYDYELIIHEIGHALGLKHPFESHGSNLVTLTDKEDNTKLTAMSYNQIISSFDGEFRFIDLMALTQLYGVNSSFNSGNDTYEFSSDSGVFIIDGAGVDIIDANNSSLDSYIDLRAGTHNYLGEKSNFISEKLQLTISHGTIIENVIAGLGDDYIVGNDSANVIITNAGDDLIFAGGGADTIQSGIGSDIIDLSEQIQHTDTILIPKFSELSEADTIYGFLQGINGDFIDLSNIIDNDASLLPVVLPTNVPEGYITGQIVRIVGNSFDTVEEVLIELQPGQLLEEFHIDIGNSAILITANSKNTGEDQNLFAIENQSSGFNCKLILTCVGNYLDIDSWSIENFINSTDFV